MYSIKKEKDIPYILKYHRAKDMVNIMKFFPGLSPVDDLVVILDEDDFEKNKDKFDESYNIRNGNPISEPCMRSIIIKNLNQDHLEALKMIKKGKCQTSQWISIKSRSTKASKGAQSTQSTEGKVSGRAEKTGAGQSKGAC